MLHLDPDALGVLRYTTLDVEPESLARSLYGPTWREALRLNDAGWTTRRDPLPAFAADFLAEVLVGSVAHDGRSTREARSSGWWLRSASGEWRPASLDAIGRDLHRVVLSISTEATERRAAAEARLRDAKGSDHARKPGEARSLAFRRQVEEAETRARSESLRVAILSALSHLIASLGRNMAATFAALRDRLPLPADALLVIAERWLDDALLVGDVTPSPAGRISVAEVRDAYERQARSGDALPLQTLYRSLDSLLGARIRRVEWSLDALDHPPHAPEGDPTR